MTIFSLTLLGYAMAHLLWYAPPVAVIGLLACVALLVGMRRVHHLTRIGVL